MFAIFRATICVAAMLAATISGAVAANLHVTPVTIDLTAPAGAGLVTLRNDGATPVTVQMRLFQWVQEKGEDVYRPTRDVAVSPPMTTLAPGGQQTIRVVRTAKAATAQDSYRLFVDELPQATRRTEHGVRFLIRKSIPVFFSGRNVSRAQVSWSVQARGRTFSLIGKNSGSDRQKVSRLLVRDQGGRALVQVDGLAGYVLGRSTRRWDFDMPAGTTLRGLTLTAEDDKGAFRATVTAASGG